MNNTIISVKKEFMKPPKLSVIVPIFNSENYIEKCLRTLFEQTLDDIEYIFINDCTPDNSLKILHKISKEYPNRQSQIKILHNQRNRGISATRNIGINAATGSYLIHCDSDDWVDPTMYEALYQKAESNDYDLVWCDYYRMVNNRKILKKQNCSPDKHGCIKALLNGQRGNNGQIWNKLVKRELYVDHNIRFPEEFNILEDFSTVIRLFHYSSNIAYLPIPLYHYQVKKNSLSKTNSEFEDNSPHITDRLKATKFIYDFFRSRDILHAYEREMNHNKLIVKNFILRNAENKKKWLGLFPESNKYIMASPLPITLKLALGFAAANSAAGYRLALLIHNFILKLIRIQNKDFGF